MIYKILFAITDGIIFSILSIGLIYSFKWLRFPDLTPDGSFILGSATFVILTNESIGLHPFYALCISFVLGFLAGTTTAVLNQVIRIPAFISGLITSLMIYSIVWLTMDSPTLGMKQVQTFTNWTSGIDASKWLLVIVCFVAILISLGSSIIGDSKLGIQLRAFGENPKMAFDLNKQLVWYYLVGLGLANGFAAICGVWFTHRSYSADINSGNGQTLIGLIGMVLAIILIGKSKSLLFLFLAVIIGSIFYKLIVMTCLSFGIRAETYQLISGLFLILLFFISRSSKINVLNDLRWN